MKIWLDDIRPAPSDEWIVLRRGNALCGMLMAHDGKVEMVSFDHDLAHFEGDKELTGYVWLCQIEAAVADGLIRHPPKMEVHSANPAVRKKMEQAITNIERLVS